MDPATETKSLDVRAYLRILWRRLWILLSVVVVAPVAVYFVSEHSSKTYQSSTLLELQPTFIDTSEGATQGGPTSQFIAIAARLIQTTGVADAAAKQLSGPKLSPSALLGAISVSSDPTTGFITITAKAPSAQQAADIANAFGAAINSARAQEAVSQLNQQIAGLNAQIVALSPRAVAIHNQLVVQRERLRAERAAQGSNAQVIEPATASGSPVAPRPSRNALLALVVAVILGLCLIALVESVDRRIRRPEEVEEHIGLPLLSSVPRSAFGSTVDSPLGIEAYRTLRANLRFFNVDHDIRSIVVTSGRQGEGKTTVALGLAKAYAFSGSNVVLIDADLRRPAVASRFGAPAGTGLAGVLIGSSDPSEALIDITVPGGTAGRLRIMPGGEIPPNPAELLSSQRMHRLLEELSTECDLIVIDTSPLLAVSDALPLLDEGAGTLLVARVGVVQRDDLRYLQRVLRAAGSRSLGVVVTGLSERNSYPYEYAQGAPPARNGAVRRPLALISRRRS